MKTSKTITINPEIWIQAKQRTDNISGTIEFLLRRWIETEAEEYERNKLETLKLELDKKQAELAAAKATIDNLSKEKRENKVVMRIGGE